MLIIRDTVIPSVWAENISPSSIISPDPKRTCMRRKIKVKRSSPEQRKGYRKPSQILLPGPLAGATSNPTLNHAHIGALPSFPGHLGRSKLRMDPSRLGGRAAGWKNGSHNSPNADYLVYLSIYDVASGEASRV